MATTTKYQEPGQFDLQSATLITGEGTEVDLSNLVVQIEFYEDINANCVAGYIAIQDTVGLVNSAPIIGQEYLQILITTPSLTGQKSEINFTENLLHVTGIADQFEAGNNMSITTLEFVTSEFIHNRRTRIERQLQGEYSDLVKTLLEKDLTCKKDLYIETTVGVKHVNPCNHTPFKMITEWSRQSLSKENGSPTYHFFENLKGYHFRSLESMYAEGSKFEFLVVEPGSKVSEEPGVRSGRDHDLKMTRDMAQIQDFTVSSAKNLNDVMPSGALSSTMTSHNIFHKSYTTTTFNYFDNRQKEKHINTFALDPDNPIYSEAVVDEKQRRITDFKYTTFLTPDSEIRTINSEANFEEDGATFMNAQFDIWSDAKKKYNFTQRKSPAWLQRRRSNLSMLENSGSLTLDVFGNTSIGCGDLVTVNLPEANHTSSDESDGTNRFYRGVHLIKTLKHTFNMASKKHTMNMILAKDSVENKFKPDPADGFVEIKPTNAGRLFNESDFYGDTLDYDE